MSDEPARPPRRRRGRGLFSLFLIAAFAGAWVALYGFVELADDEVALVTRGGRLVRELEGPGRHVHWPFPIERRFLLSRAARGFPEGRASVVTRDAQLFEARYSGRYRVDDPAAARFGLRSAEGAVDIAVGAALAALATEHAGEGFAHLGARLADMTRRAADTWLRERGTGLRIASLSVDLEAPSAVAELDAEIADLQSRRDSLAAATREETEALLSAARIRALDVTTAARLEHDALVSRASGEAARFRALAAEYRRAPEVVRTRIYLETMETILGSARVVVADPGAPLPAAVAPSPAGAPRGPSTTAPPPAVSSGAPPEAP